MTTTYPADKGEWGPVADDHNGTESLLERIRSRFEYHVKAWEETRKEAEKDQKAQSTGGPWTEEERSAREIRGRPCIHLDQISQHVNALINEVRSNPIAIKVDPLGEGANKETANLRARRIRAIEYESNGPEAYIKAFENAVTMSFGCFWIDIEYTAWDSMQRKIFIRPSLDPYSVLWDPDARKLDLSDMKDAFELFRIQKKDFAREFPDAEETSFGTEKVNLAPSWFDDDSVQIAKYWHVDTKKRRMFHVLENGEIKRYFADELGGFKLDGSRLIFKNGKLAEIRNDRYTEQPFVRYCITNGIEILQADTDWPGKTIPLVVIIGKERWRREGNRTKREIESYVRPGRDGQMLFDFYCSNEAETIGMAPKVLYLGYEGQFEQPYWNEIHKDPRPFAEISPVRDSTSGEILPLPTRNTYEPPVQALEIGKESARRNIQAAMGSYGFTRLDDTNVKSGIALQKIQQQNQQGAYHFMDAYKNAIKRAGRIINDLLDDVEADPMDVSLRDLDESTETMRINTRDKSGRMVAYRLTDDGQHEVTVTQGPKFDSQRQEGSAFGDTLVQNIRNLGLPPPITTKLLALVVQLKNLGPVGDKMIRILDPDQAADDPQQQLQLLMGQLEQMNQVAEALGQKVQVLETEKLAKTLELESRERIAALQADVNKFKIVADLWKAGEQMASAENIEASRESLAMQQQELQTRINQVAADNLPAQNAGNNP